MQSKSQGALIGALLWMMLTFPIVLYSIGLNVSISLQPLAWPYPQPRSHPQRTSASEGEGVSQKQTRADAGGRGSVAKSERPQIQIFTKIFEA